MLFRSSEELEEETTAAKPVEPERHNGNDDDDLYMSWDEYERLSKSVEPVGREQSHAPVSVQEGPLAVDNDDASRAGEDGLELVTNTVEREPSVASDASRNLAYCEELELQATEWLKECAPFIM